VEIFIFKVAQPLKINIFMVSIIILVQTYLKKDTNTFPTINMIIYNPFGIKKEVNISKSNSPKIFPSVPLQFKSQ